MPLIITYEEVRWAFDLAFKIAPNQATQLKVVDIYKAMISDGATDRDIILAMTDILQNGLRYGNWPH